jgi:hypothetical protein
LVRPIKALRAMGTASLLRYRRSATA